MILALTTFLIELRHFFNNKQAAWITTQSCKWLSHMLHTHQWMRFSFQQSSNLSCLIKSRAAWIASLPFFFSYLVFWVCGNMFLQMFSLCLFGAACSLLPLSLWSSLDVPERFIIDTVLLRTGRTRPPGSQWRGRVRARPGFRQSCWNK